VKNHSAHLADVADFMLEQLNDDTYIGTAPGVCY
jgi:hypothetical protein